MTVVLIPAYEPGANLVALVRDLRTIRSGRLKIDAVVVVDDGSGGRYRNVFDDAAAGGAIVIRSEPNLGKGYALKHGFAYVHQNFPGCEVVCADCDGQHDVDAITTVGRALHGRTATMILGSRDFTGDVPARSRLGNSTTKYFYSVTTGTRLQDTQTGLRGYSPDVLPWLCAVPGNRFEYELNLLLHAEGAGVAIEEVPIATVYLDENASSHFRPIVDSARVYAPLVKFGASSIVAFLIDVIGLMILFAMTSKLLLSVVVARCLSALFNFTVNRHLVFRKRAADPHQSSLVAAATRYFTLVGIVLVCNYGLMRLLIVDVGAPVLLAKTITELLLFSFSFQIQRRYIFGDRTNSHPNPQANSPQNAVKPKPPR